MPTFDRGSVRFAYETLGEGRPIVLNHGLGGDRTQPKDLLGVAPNCHAVFWDCRGHGETEPVGPEDGFSFPEFSKDLAALFAELGLRRAVVGGISMGAALSTRFALDHPGKVEALILIRPAWLASPNPPNLELAPKVSEWLAAKESGTEHPIDEALESVPAAFRDAFLLQVNRPKAVERRARLERMPASSPISGWAEAEGIECPTLVIGNEDDPLHPLEFAQEWAARIKGAKYVLVPPKPEDLERHNHETRRAILQFLDEAGP